jgi:UPF0716 family protein affecting phage T7 exclusion
MWLLLAFIAVPLIEIGLFIKVGGWLTLWPTLGIVLATGIIGTYLVRQQGLKVLSELRNSMSQMRDPLSPLAHGAMILFAGALLLTPGFFTDAVGFLLLHGDPCEGGKLWRRVSKRPPASGEPALQPPRRCDRGRIFGPDRTVKAG